MPGLLDMILRLLGGDLIEEREIPAEDIGRKIGRKLGLGPAYGDDELNFASAYGGMEPRGTTNYSALTPNRPGLSLDDMEPYRRPPISVARQDPYHPSYDPGGALPYSGTAPEIPSSSLGMRMLLNGRDITDERNVLTGGLGLPAGMRRVGGGGFSDPVLRKDGVPEWAPVEELQDENDISALSTALTKELVENKAGSSGRMALISEALERAKRASVNRELAPLRLEQENESRRLNDRKAQAEIDRTNAILRRSSREEREEDELNSLIGSLGEEGARLAQALIQSNAPRSTVIALMRARYPKKLGVTSSTAGDLSITGGTIKNDPGIIEMPRRGIAATEPFEKIPTGNQMELRAKDASGRVIISHDGGQTWYWADSGKPVE